MSTVSVGIIQDLTCILNNIKSKDESLKVLSLNQLSTFLNTNREYVDEIIEEMCKFLDSEKRSIEESFFYKIIIKFYSKLEEKNISTIKFINKIFPMLMVHIYYYKDYKKNEDNKFYEIISYFTKKCEKSFANDAKAKEGCMFLATWMEAAGNPIHEYKEVECPAGLKAMY